MFRRIRRTRLFLAACALPLGAIHAGLLAVSVFLHGVADREPGGLSATVLHHHHEFELRDGPRTVEDPGLHCPGCLLERNPAARAPSSAVLSPSQGAAAVRIPFVKAAGSRLAGTTASRAPPRS